MRDGDLEDGIVGGGGAQQVEGRGDGAHSGTRWDGLTAP
jgi:hypothetical protein